MWSGSDYASSICAPCAQPDEHRRVASLLGFLAGGFSGALGALISLAVIIDRPEPRTKTHCQDRAGSERTACAVVLIVIVVAEV
ncbi:MAG TPA: hypothetical protein VE440_03675 [Gaiellaceae bacterium]|nr:hypothetical protein [Gaiellaceae bacterium]